MVSKSLGPCCFTGFKHEGTPTGEIKPVGNVQTYLAYPTDNKISDTAVLLLTDAFGIGNNSQLLADDFAANGYLTVVPDLFDGDQLNFGDFEAGKINVPEWLSRHGNDVVDPIVNNTIEHLRQTLGIKRIAGAGYCLGGKYVVRFLNDGKLDTGYSGHPSFVSDDELAAIKKPLSVSAAEVDDIFTTDLRHKSESILAETTQPWQIDLFSQVSHGFAIRADLNLAQNKFAKEQAFLQALVWYNHTL
ncbi:dienelactone hydrolase family protein [Xylogone sp. PMI_703]|nr:dienelactone hydrolase family protein [Xylogone sp. PMI_703]